MEQDTYVLDNTEVKLTNRRAQKTLKSGTIDTLYEVTPANTISGSWKKWVLLSELYVLVNQQEL